MTSPTTLGILTVCALLTGTAQAQIVEDFEGGNPDNWRMEFDGTFNGFPVPAIPGVLSTTGGNPGGQLSWTQIQSPVNVWHLNNDGSSDWRGDFRAKHIEGASMDMRYVGTSPFGMHMYVVLADDMGTPEITDDILIWTPVDFNQYGFAGFGAALPPGVWNTLNWPIPASSPTLPAGWTVWSHSGTNSGNDDLDWNNVIQNVDYLAFVNGAPWGGTTLGFIDIDFDNLILETGALGTPFCFCDGSGQVAPCGNQGGAGRGCGNSANPSGAELSAQGSANVSASSVVLSATGAPANVFGMFFQGDNQAANGNGVIFNDGLLCATGAIRRLGIVGLDGTGSTQSTVDIAVVGGLPASGGTRSYQFWYRDPQGGPCATTANTSNALEIVWLP